MFTSHTYSLPTGLRPKEILYALHSYEVKSLHIYIQYEFTAAFSDDEKNPL